MEEDIEILEEIKTILEPYKVINWEFFIVNRKNICQALENLIKGYRELKEENNKFRNGDIITPKLEAKTRKIIFNDLKDYIPKSKIKEKIKELRKEEERVYNLVYEVERVKYIDMVIGKIALLQELMEDK